MRNLFVKERESFTEIAKKFAAEIDKRGIRNIVLFGSVARGEFTGKSDIDLLFICERPKTVEDRVKDLSQDFLDDYDTEISPVFMSVVEAGKKKKEMDRFIIKVLEEGKILYGDIKWLEK